MSLYAMHEDLVAKLSTGLKKLTDCIDQGHPYEHRASPYHPRSNIIEISCSNCGYPLSSRPPIREEIQAFENLMRTPTVI